MIDTYFAFIRQEMKTAQEKKEQAEREYTEWNEKFDKLQDILLNAPVTATTHVKTAKDASCINKGPKDYANIAEFIADEEYRPSGIKAAIIAGEKEVKNGNFSWNIRESLPDGRSATRFFIDEYIDVEEA